MVELGTAEFRTDVWVKTMLYLTTYVFLLRLLTEALHITHGDAEGGPANHPAVIWLEDEYTVVLRLVRRKNLPAGSTMRRTCWCQRCPLTCPVHKVFRFFQGYPIGSEPFASISPAVALRWLRVLLHRMGVPQAETYRTHDLRRGHAQELVDNGANLAEILQAGQGRSPAFLAYVDTDTLENNVVQC